MAGEQDSAADPRKSEAFAVASGLFQGVVVISQFVRSWVRTWIAEHRLSTEASAVVFGQFLRVDSWLRTLAKLDEPADFQGVGAAARSLLETTIDIVLLCATPANHEQLLAWEESAKLRYAEQLARHVAKGGSSPPPDYQHVIAFASNDKKRIEALRRRFGWLEHDERRKKKGDTRHPDRWTNRNLADDARFADKLGHSFHFETFYETEYRKLCWLVHGSAFAIRGIDAGNFPGVAGLLFPACGDMGLLSAELVLRHLGLWSNERAAKFDEIRKQRIVTTAQTRRASLGLPLIPT
jgi:hypothetical protein